MLLTFEQWTAAGGKSTPDGNGGHYVELTDYRPGLATLSDYRVDGASSGRYHLCPLRPLDSAAALVTAFRSFDELRDACAVNGYVPTLTQEIAARFDRLDDERRTARKLLANALQAAGLPVRRSYSAAYKRAGGRKLFWFHCHANSEGEAARLLDGKALAAGNPQRLTRRYAGPLPE